MTVRFNDIFSEEIKSLQARRVEQQRPEIPLDGTQGVLPSTRLGLTGLSLSGGGVRSASFCLGVLQAIHGKVGLGSFDYLSSVSGGGYIGATTTIGMSVTGQFPFGLTGADPGETGATQHIRDNSRYLVKDGAASVLSALAVYLRGIAMNVLIILPLMLLLAAVIIVATAGRPWLLQQLASWGGPFTTLPDLPLGLSVLTALVLALLLALYALAVSVHRIVPLEHRQRLARLAGTALIVSGGFVLLVDWHPALLLRVLAPAAKDAAGDPGQTLQVLRWLVEFANRFGLVLAPFVAVLVPYLKPIVAKAASSGDGWGDLVTRIGSRAVLLLVATIVPLMLWVWTMQIAYWGLYEAACGWTQPAPATTVTFLGSSVRCDPTLAAPGWLAGLFSMASADGSSAATSWQGAAVTYACLSILFFYVWPALNVNANSLHQLYRDRLGSAFLIASVKVNGRPRVKNCDDFRLSDMDVRTAPYHLINAALNVPGSKEANQRGRNADFFIFSRKYVGSPLTGYVQTELVEHIADKMNLGTAMAISGAAAAPNMGMISMRPLSPTIALLNVRLGRWLRHPAAIEEDAVMNRSAPLPGPWYFLREAFSKSGRDLKNGMEGMDAGPLQGVAPNDAVPLAGECADFVFLTDGGHIENLGVYELLRRRCRLIVAVDAEADPEGRFFALEQLQRFASIDLGTKIAIDVRPIAEGSAAVTARVRAKKFPKRKAGPHVAVGFIDYPPRERSSEPREQGLLVYVKASMSGDENDYVTGYKMRNPAFPQESTADQFFSEEQLEVYRALGEHVMRRFLTGEDTFAAHEDNRAALRATLDTLLPGAACP